MKENQLTCRPLHTSTDSTSNLNQTRLGEEAMIGINDKNIYTRKGELHVLRLLCWLIWSNLYLERLEPGPIYLLISRIQSQFSHWEKYAVRYPLVFLLSEFLKQIKVRGTSFFSAFSIYCLNLEGRLCFSKALSNPDNQTGLGIMRGLPWKRRGRLRRFNSPCLTFLSNSSVEVAVKKSVDHFL